MKLQTRTVDDRIKAFMKSKMEEFPELKEKNGPRVEVVQRGYLYEDFISLFRKRNKVVY